MSKEVYFICQKIKNNGKTKFIPLSPLFDDINYFIKVKGAQINIKILSDSSQIKIIPEEKIVKRNIFSYFRNWMNERKRKKIPKDNL